ncbi:MAG TPA: ABC transporter substrate-binding protein, partial [Spirochaetia bacterium]|nr:ABC transporter substrate-binding protein [Spirochaetia bacterium]
NLESGAIDFIKMPPRNEVARLDKDPRFKAVVSPIGNFFYAITFNVEHPILKNKKVRQALAYTMDRKRFVDTFIYGQSTPQCVPFAKQSAAYEEKYNDFYSFDLDKAKRLLAEAGYPNGFDISIMVMTEADPANLQFSVMWKEDLKKIGVNLTINHVEISIWQDGKVNAKFPEILQDLYGRGAKEPIAMCKQSLPWKPDTNPSRFVSQRYRDLVAKAEVEADDAKRKALYHEILMLLLDEAFELPIAPQTRFWGMKKNVMDVDQDLNIFEMFSRAWIEK